MTNPDFHTLNLPFRIGATSYIIADDLIPNARFLATRVQDMQLVLFDLADGPSNLPTPADVNELAAIGRANDLSYTVHLIRDLRWDETGDGEHISLAKARQVIELTRALDPFAYVVHLDGAHVREPETSQQALNRWYEDEVCALASVAGWAGDPGLLAVENLESYPPDFVSPVVARAGVSRCVDVGHLWLDGHDPLPYLTAALSRTRTIHLHGVINTDDGLRDHVSLAHMPPSKLDPIINLLLHAPFTGVLTLEIFDQDDFNTSLAALLATSGRLTS